MKKILTLLTTVSLVGSVWAFDPYMPVEAGKGSAELGINYYMETGSYDADGEKQDADNSPSAITTDVQVKYGIIPGLEASLALEYVVSNDPDVDGVDGETGLLQPSLAVKYAFIPEVAAALNFTLPLGTEDIVGENPNTAIALGVLFGKNMGQLDLTAAVMYNYMLENDDKMKQDAINIYVEPAFAVNEQLTVWLGIDYTMAMELQVDGENAGFDGYLLTVDPAVAYSVNDQITVELDFDISVLGQTADSYMMPALTGYYNF